MNVINISNLDFFNISKEEYKKIAEYSKNERVQQKSLRLPYP